MENHQPKRRSRTAASRTNPQSKTPDSRTAVTAYNGNSYMRYCVQWKITSSNADSGSPPAGKIPNPKSPDRSRPGKFPIQIRGPPPASRKNPQSKSRPDC